jgi:hypothetical protein
VDGVSQVRTQAIGPGLCRIAYMNFVELREGEVQLPRIPIPRTRVNKGKKRKGRDLAPRPFLRRGFKVA